jgi:hypothetical protein
MAAGILAERAAKKLPIEPVVIPLSGSDCGGNCVCAAKTESAASEVQL